MVKEYLLSHPEKVGPTQASAHLLQLAYAGEDCLEWNLFTKLDPKTIKAALTSDALKGATGISLTALQNSEPAELLAALSSLDRLHTLQVLDRPDREDEGASNRLFEALAESDYPLALKKLTLTGLYANGIRQNIWRPYRDQPKTLEAFPVVQLLVSHEGKDSGFVASSELQLESFYLGDAPLTPTRFINRLFPISRIPGAVFAQLQRNWPPVCTLLLVRTFSPWRRQIFRDCSTPDRDIYHRKGIVPLQCLQRRTV